ncbi:abortive infection family protein [Dysgonomonas sp. GY617]|uniref:abortive infection family protein n=1 Tax=Dysgonomonas sp. GY617 TaxID=2780420 RepID=UPI0018840B9D|nr:abortive infection family protein [Dysgonomonas sp. GY617]MBF0577565.1 abortive infection family protein [Dysgonomonas sp. GY617]
MEKLKKIIEKHSRWNILSDYIFRIEAYVDSDFSMAFENSKALLESVGKEICKSGGVELNDKSTINGVLKNAAKVLGFKNQDFELHISASLGTIGQHLGDLRNKIGSTSHGKTLEELEQRNDNVNELTKEFLLGSVEILCCFLIRIFESQIIKNHDNNKHVNYQDSEGFNEYFDDLFGEFEMGRYSYPASEILYNVDNEAYINEYKSYLEEQEVMED